MKGKRSTPERSTDERRRKTPPKGRPTARRQSEAPARKRRSAPEQRPSRSAPQTSPVRRPVDTPARPKNASQAKARAKARKAKAPKIVRPPLRERLLNRLATIDFNPRTLAARVPFVVLVIAALGVGLGVTLWLSTDAASRSYQLGHARQLNQALLQQKEALERDVLEAQAPPALAEAARGLGMIPSRDTAHLVQDATGAWVVVGTPKPAEGAPPPPLNTPLPDERPAAPAPARPAAGGPPAPRVVDPREVVVRVPPRATAAPAAPLTAPAAPQAGPAPSTAPLPAAPVDPAQLPPVAAPADQVPPAAAPLVVPLPGVPAPVPAEGLPHLGTPELPAQPGPAANPEHLPAPPAAGPAPEVPAEVPVEIPAPGVPA
ncbi:MULTISPECIES: hypothetical protein [Mycobacteriaceae]|uniref:Signal peptide protein n=1 Tax=Mycolicibacterium neoaurum VKM Ac-1815D TaxID=700508 RepID=V5XFW5_MYCNE|nr:MULTISPECIES: hypothetical protein [Mycobacteriaceae]AHC26304.1 membrane protein [Mycolicibacterium neoaurum VKM Ac-1815D]AMO06666.1 membrane protein [Mycolicibacterium neoaurum]AXK74977.1 hypothetical protein DXK33_07485 [Mycolicibacterium neoaurum]KJQ48751.1 membrane protein [Mycolicibacterium neoaurum]KUM07377.1 hypothetical protein AVZ31_17085 [Mycolicibacterium neoaurum]